MLREKPRLENELCSHPYVKNSPINIRDALYGVEPKLPRHITESRRGRRYTMWTWSLYPYICEYGIFHLGHLKVYLGADCSPGCSDR